MVEFQQCGVEGEFGGGGAALEGKLRGFDDAGFQEWGESGGFAGEEVFFKRSETVGDFAYGGGAGVGGVESVGERAGAGFEGSAEAGEAELGEGDLAVRERFAQGEATGLIEGLGHGDGPGGAFAGECTGGRVDALLAERSGEGGIGQGAGGVGLSASGGDLGLIESEFGMVRGDCGDESVNGDGWLGGLDRAQGGMKAG